MVGLLKHFLIIFDAVMSSHTLCLTSNSSIFNDWCSYPVHTFLHLPKSTLRTTPFISCNSPFHVTYYFATKIRHDLRNVIGMDHRVAGEDICPKHTHYNSACFVPTVPAPSPSPSSMLKDELVFVDLLLLAQESLNMIEEHLVHYWM